MVLCSLVQSPKSKHMQFKTHDLSSIKKPQSWYDNFECSYTYIYHQRVSPHQGQDYKAFFAKKK